MLSLFFAYVSVRDIKNNDGLQIVYCNNYPAISKGSIINLYTEFTNGFIYKIDYIDNIYTKWEETVSEGEPLMPNRPDGRNWPILYTCYLPPSGTEIKAVLIDVYGGGEPRKYYGYAHFYRILAHNGIAIIEAQLSDLTKPFLETDGRIKFSGDYVKEDIDLMLYDIAYLKTHLNDIKTKNPDDPINIRLQELIAKPTFITGFSFGGFMSFNFVTKNPDDYAIDGRSYNTLFDGAIVQAGFIAHSKNDRPIDSLSNLLKGATNIEEIEPVLGPHLMLEFSPILGLKNLQKPVLFFHGTKDDVVNARHTAEAKLIAEKFGKGDLISPYTITNVAHTWPSSEELQVSRDPESLTRLDGYAQVVLSFIDSVIEGRNNISAQQKDFRKKIEEYRLSKILKEDITTEEKSYPKIVPTAAKVPQIKEGEITVHKQLITSAIIHKYNDQKLIIESIKKTFPNLFAIDRAYLDQHENEIVDVMLGKLSAKTPYDDGQREKILSMYKILKEFIGLFNPANEEKIVRALSDVLDTLPYALGTQALLVFYEELTRPIYLNLVSLLDLMEKARIPLRIDPDTINKEKIRQILRWYVPDPLFDHWLSEIIDQKKLTVPDISEEELKAMLPLDLAPDMKKKPPVIIILLRGESFKQAILMDSLNIREIAERHENEIRPIMNKEWAIISFEELKAEISKMKANTKEKRELFLSGARLLKEKQAVQE